jgi:broad specificity phosphatase PhoE
MSSPTTPHRNTPPKTIIGLLRHGITLWNEDKRVQGSMDSPLSSKGREITTAWAEQLADEKWDRIVASDLGRVKETVAILNSSLKLPLNFDPRLREMHWGKWEGLRVEDVYNQEAAMVDQMVQAGWEFRPPEGESRKEALKRAKSAILDAVSKWPGQKILVVCHLGIIKCMICDSVGSTFLPGETPAISKNSMHLLETENTGFKCLKINISLRAGR